MSKEDEARCRECPGGKHKVTNIISEMKHDRSIISLGGRMLAASNARQLIGYGARITVRS